MKTKTITLTINVPEPGDALPFEVLKHPLVEYAEDGVLVYSTRALGLILELPEELPTGRVVSE